MIIDKYEQKIGIIGVTTTFPGKWGKAKVLPEIANVQKEVAKLVNKGIKIIILLSHSGLNVDQEIAKNVEDIDIIIGGHTHSFLYSSPEPYGPDIPVSDYPTIEKNPSGKDVLIVQASAYTKYLGNITLFFDKNGEIQDYEGAPIFLDHEIPQDDEIIEALKPWKDEILKFESKLLGNVSFTLDSACHTKECGMGNFITDAMVDAVSIAYI
jgi:5'-nucleotidase